MKSHGTLCSPLLVGHRPSSHLLHPPVPHQRKLLGSSRPSPRPGACQRYQHLPLARPRAELSQVSKQTQLLLCPEQCEFHPHKVTVYPHCPKSPFFPAAKHKHSSQRAGRSCPRAGQTQLWLCGSGRRSLARPFPADSFGHGHNLLLEASLG